jgi:hypothetical protein
VISHASCVALLHVLFFLNRLFCLAQMFGRVLCLYLAEVIVNLLRHSMGSFTKEVGFVKLSSYCSKQT